MNLKGFITRILPGIVNFKLAYKKLLRPKSPVTLTFSVTNKCQSKCHTCQIWQLYRKNPSKIKQELTKEEIKKIFKSMGEVYFLNISGGEPFLRKDLPEIIELAMKYLNPGIVHIPTNGIATDRILNMTKNILEILAKYGKHIPLTIKPSFDGIGDEHDRIRGIKGNFEKLLDTVERLKKMSVDYPNLHVELGTVISKENMNNIDEIANYAHSMGIESYRNEIAEQRAEFFNKEDPITPSAEEYRSLIEIFSRKTRDNLKGKKKLTRLTESLRLVYYDIASKIIANKKQVIPCYAGISNVHLNPYGELWPCCVLAYDKPMGNLKESGYDFKKIWYSKEADEVRRSIKNQECYCPLANQAYSNILCDPVSLAKVFRNILRS
jgi:MoaA/NifB/PqqE/SkfB family radical SAM enzyme